jgi:hypothetical protein
MSKKRLDVTSITNELRGQSVFFPKVQKEQKDQVQQLPTPTLKEPKKQREASSDTTVSRYHATKQPSNHDTTQPLTEEDIFEVVRKAVKQIGKEAATHRFTPAEKNLLTDIEYTYRRQGIRTSENEITRIAINYFIEDYQKNGERSLLARILKRLNS